MKKFFYAIAVLAIGLVAVSCEKDDKKTEENSIVGEWSNFRGGPEVTEGVFVHLSIKPDGKFEMVMPAWIERRIGTYNVQGNRFSFKIDKLEWVINRGNGYVNVYDQYGCWFKNDDWELPDNQREKYDDPHAKWKEEWPDDAAGELEFSFDKSGNLIFKGDNGILVVGDFPYLKDPDFDAVEAANSHLN